MISGLVGQIRGESPRLVHVPPHWSAAVVVVGEHFVVVRVQTGQQRTPRRAAHGGRAVGVPELGALVPEQFFCFLHVVQRAWIEYKFSKKETSHAGNTRQMNARTARKEYISTDIRIVCSPPSLREENRVIERMIRIFYLFF